MWTSHDQLDSENQPYYGEIDLEKVELYLSLVDLPSMKLGGRSYTADLRAFRGLTREPFLNRW